MWAGHLRTPTAWTSAAEQKSGRTIVGDRGVDIVERHRWDVNPAGARAIQAELAGKGALRHAVSLDAIRTVAGADNAYPRPRRFGLASHPGVNLGQPTIGCARSRLSGEYDEPGQEFGAAAPFIDHDEVIGAAVRSRPHHKPLFVTSGRLVSVESAVALTRSCCRNGRFMPVPTRLAHETVTRERRARLEAEHSWTVNWGASCKDQGSTNDASVISAGMEMSSNSSSVGAIAARRPSALRGAWRRGLLSGETRMTGTGLVV